MTDRQRENLAKYLHDMSKGVALIAVVGSLVGGQATVVNAILGLVVAGMFLLIGYWLDGVSHDDF